MAHFAELNADNIVIRVVVISNDEIIDSNGNEREGIGVNRCRELFGNNTRWKQTSYHGSIRKNYAGVGYQYNSELDAFIPPRPYPSWTLDTDTCMWIAPMPMPIDNKLYIWNEGLLRWVSF